MRPALVILLATAAAAAAEEFPDRWKTLFPTKAAATPLVPLEELSFDGPHVGHPFYLGNFDVADGWDVSDGLLHATNKGGGSAAIELGEAVDFRLEGVMDASDTGGLFFLVGLKDGRGHGVWNATLRKSGSPWGVFEMRGDKAIEGTAVEYDPYEWKGEKPFTLTVEGGKLSLAIGPRTVIDAHPLENYEGGRIVFGVYETRYGPRNVRIRALRARSLPAGG